MPAEIETVFDRDFIIYELIGNSDEILLLNEYLEIMKSFLKNIIDSLKQSGKWKTKFSAKIIFKSSKDIDYNSHKYLWVSKKDIMTSEKTEEVIKEHFKLIFTNYQDIFENRIKSSDFVFEFVD